MRSYLGHILSHLIKFANKNANPDSRRFKGNNLWKNCNSRNLTFDILVRMCSDVVKTIANLTFLRTSNFSVKNDLSCSFL